MSVRIYVEGGFAGTTKTTCRKAFRIFFEKTIPHGSFRVIASGSKENAYKDFCAALRQHHADHIILLVDSDKPVIASPWKHLATRQNDGWVRPHGAKDDQIQLMVQVMESWFLADPDALAKYYGQGFKRGSLPRQPNIEQVSKADIFHALTSATKATQKGRYDKTQHGFDLIERLDPSLIRKASQHAERLLATLEREVSDQGQ